VWKYRPVVKRRCEISRTSFRGLLVILYTKCFHRTASKVGAERKRLSITPFWLLKSGLLCLRKATERIIEVTVRFVCTYVYSAILSSRNFGIIFSPETFRWRAPVSHTHTYAHICFFFFQFEQVYCFLNKARNHFVFFFQLFYNRV